MKKIIMAISSALTITACNNSESTLTVEQTVNDTLWKQGSNFEFSQKDSSNAYKYYKQSADMGNAIGYYMLGHALEHGIGVEENKKLSKEAYQKSVKLLNQLLEKGDDKILLNFIGSAYYWGDGVEQDRKKAFNYYLRSAELGNPECQFKIANCYEKGIGVDLDLEKAMHWYREAASQGWAEAVEKLKNL